jgi:hypothetical protein
MISTICPECDRELKLKDELAGRKIKCPGCGAAIPVPGGGNAAVTQERPRKSRSADQEAVIQAATSKKRPAADEDRPRKKKKQKASNLVLWMGVAAAAVLLLGCLVGVGIYLATKSPSTEQAKGPSTKSEKLRPKEEPDAQTKKQPKNVIVRGMELQDVKNAMKQLGLAWLNYLDSVSKKGPPNREALSPFYENNVTINTLLKDGTVVFIWNAGVQQMPKGTSNTILAYEKESYTNSLRVVLFGDGRVEMVDDAEFAATPKAEPVKK